MPAVIDLVLQRATVTVGARRTIVEIFEECGFVVEMILRQRDEDAARVGTRIVAVHKSVDLGDAERICGDVDVA